MLDDLIPDDISDTEAWAVIVGFFVPLIVGRIVNAKWPDWVKAAVSFGVSAVIGTITALLAGSYEGLSIPSAILLTFVVSIAAYSQFWKKVMPGIDRHDPQPPKHAAAPSEFDQIIDPKGGH